MAISVQLKIVGMKEALEVVRLLQLSPAEKRRYLKRVGYLAKIQARKNLEQQKTANGKPFVPRSLWSDKIGPMLRKIAKGCWMGSRPVGDNAAEVYFPYKRMINLITENVPVFLAVKYIKSVKESWNVKMSTWPFLDANAEQRKLWR